MAIRRSLFHRSLLMGTSKAVSELTYSVASNLPRSSDWVFFELGRLFATIAAALGGVATGFSHFLKSSLANGVPHGFAFVDGPSAGCITRRSSKRLKSRTFIVSS